MLIGAYPGGRIRLSHAALVRGRAQRGAAVPRRRS
jgi:hypothetical protein